jgi:hypothetical protein
MRGLLYIVYQNLGYTERWLDSNGSWPVDLWDELACSLRGLRRFHGVARGSVLLSLSWLIAYITYINCPLIRRSLVYRVHSQMICCHSPQPVCFISRVGGTILSLSPAPNKRCPSCDHGGKVGYISSGGSKVAGNWQKSPPVTPKPPGT